MRRVQRLICCLSFSALMILASACGDDAKNTDSDATASSSGASSSGTSSGDMSSSGADGASSGMTTGVEEVMFPAGSFFMESSDPMFEFPDCINDCENAASDENGVPKEPKSVRDFPDPNEGFAGIIDGQCHAILRDGTLSNGPDSDVFTFVGGARQVIEIEIEPVGGSFQPVMYTLDGTQILTFSGASEPGGVARTKFAVPIANLPFFVLVDDAVNNDLLDTTSGPFADCSKFSGGADFGYVARVNTFGFQPLEIAASGTEINGESIAEQGDVNYYRFYAPWDRSPQVQVTRASGGAADFQPTIVAMNTIQSQVAWETVRNDGTESGTGDLNQDGFVEIIGGFRACDGSDTACQSTDAEFIFAVLDWNGSGGAGFDYNVTVSW